MRISTNTIFDSNVAAMGQQQARMLQTQQQIATGRRILSAADDPAAAARALDVAQAVAANTQYTSNRNEARNTLSLADSTLQSVTTLIQDVRTAAVNAGDGALTDSDRHTIASDLSGRLQELIGLANSTDGSGNYLFSGFQLRTKPFVDTPAGVSYFGDSGQRNIQVSASRQVASSDPGSDVFMRIMNGNGTFVTQPGTNTVTPGPNLGTGVISAGSVANPPPASLPLDNYRLSFTVTPGVAGAPPVTTYDVTDTTTAAVVSTGNAYTSGQNISFAGVQFDIQGAPANGDTFTVSPSASESLFKTISDLVSLLNTPVPVAANGGTTNITNGLNRGITNLDNALNNVLTIDSSLGLRINEIDALQAQGDSLGVQYKQTLSQLQDVDYNKAISDLTLQKTSLQAAQQSFAKVSELSLFTYI
jgi:flagellar hook-associated protein 3 FlgL